MKTKTIVILAAALGGTVLAAFFIRKAGGAVGAVADKVARTATDVVEAVNPTNPDNVFAAGVNKAGQVATGDSAWNLGSAWYEFWNPNRIRADAPASTRASAPPYGIDLGTYASTAADDDAAIGAMARFGVTPFDVTNANRVIELERAQYPAISVYDLQGPAFRP